MAVVGITAAITGFARRPRRPLTATPAQLPEAQLPTVTPAAMAGNPYTELIKHIVETNGRAARSAILVLALLLLVSAAIAVVLLTGLAADPVELLIGGLTGAAAGRGLRIVGRERQRR